MSAGGLQNVARPKCTRLLNVELEGAPATAKVDPAWHIFAYMHFSWWKVHMYIVFMLKREYAERYNLIICACCIAKSALFTFKCSTCMHYSIWKCIYVYFSTWTCMTLRYHAEWTRKRIYAISRFPSCCLELDYVGIMADYLFVFYKPPFATASAELGKRRWWEVIG